jgi:enterochelin esterase-like enzyme
MRIYLPDGYDDKAAARYPVVYLLHGTNSDEAWWTGPGGAQATLDALIKRGQLRPSIVVMPGNGNNWYVDSAAEKAESALVGELLPFIEGKYHAAAERGARSIGGFSMGGYGALRLALRHPDRFCAAMLLSPAIYDPLPPSTSSARADLPFQSAGQFDPARWKALNYPALLPAYRAAPDKVAFWILSGDHDRHGIALQAAQLNAALQPMQAKQVELRIVDGDHEAMVWRDGLADALRYADAQCAHQP